MDSKRISQQLPLISLSLRRLSRPPLQLIIASFLALGMALFATAGLAQGPPSDPRPTL